MSTIKSSNEHLTINADGSSKDIKFQANGVEKASISSAGVLSSAGGSTHADNVKAKFGTGNDLEIYHDGSATRVKNSTGNLSIQADTINLTNLADNDSHIFCNSTGVGVGTTSPAITGLHVYHATLNNVVRIESGDASAGIEFKDNNTTNLPSIYNATDDLIVSTGGAESMRITSDGRGLSQFTAKAWCTWTQVNTHTIGDSHNISSTSDQGVGATQLNFSNNMAQSQYVVNVTGRTGAFGFDSSRAAGNVNVGFRNASDNAEDSANAMCVVFGD